MYVFSDVCISECVYLYLILRIPGTRPVEAVAQQASRLHLRQRLLGPLYHVLVYISQYFHQSIDQILFLTSHQQHTTHIETSDPSSHSFRCFSTIFPPDNSNHKSFRTSCARATTKKFGPIQLSLDSYLLSYLI